MSDYSIFKEPVKVAGTEFPNRFFMAPMTMAVSEYVGMKNASTPRAMASLMMFGMSL